MKAKKIIFILLGAILLYLLWKKLMPTTATASTTNNAASVNTNTVTSSIGNVVSEIGKLLNAPTGSSTTGTPATT